MSDFDDEPLPQYERDARAGYRMFGFDPDDSLDQQQREKDNHQKSNSCSRDEKFSYYNGVILDVKRYDGTWRCRDCKCNIPYTSRMCG